MKKIFITILLVISSFVLASCGQKAVEKIEVESGLTYTYTVGDTPDFKDVKVKVIYNDGNSAVVGYSELKFSNIDTSSAGTKDLVISYQEVSITVKITLKAKTPVNDPDDGKEDENSVDYTVFSVEYDDNMTAFMAAGGNKTQFTNKDFNYVVGNVNKFYFNLKLSVVDDNMNPQIVHDYIATSSVYLIEDETETLLEGEDLEQYVAIDESEHSFDFTSEAEGKTFKLVTRPLYGVAEGSEEVNSKSLVVDVVNAYNVYNAWELNIITNANHKIEKTETNPSVVAASFLKNYSVTRPANLAGVVIHKNLTIEVSDLPQEYFYTTTEDVVYKYTNKEGIQVDAVWPAGTKFFYDHLSMYEFEFDGNTDNFSVYGNYFTIYTHKLPCVAPKNQANNGNDLSAAQVFMFSTASKLTKDFENFDHTKYTANMVSLSLRDDNGTDDDNSASMRHMLGLLAVKAYKCITNITNTNIQAYYISLHAIRDCLTVNITDSKFYNAWQNHILTWAENDLQRNKNVPVDQIHKNHTNIKVNVKNSSIAKCGGPAIINMICLPKDTVNTYSATDINISADSKVYSYVTGQEAWFTAMSATTIVAQIKALNGLFGASGGTGSFLTKLPNNGDTQFFNMVMANIPYSDSGAAGIFGAGDIDGKFTYGDQVLLDMNDSQFGSFGDPYVAGYAANALTKSAPIFKSNNGTVAVGIQGSTKGLNAFNPTQQAVGYKVKEQSGYAIVIPNGLYQQDTEPANPDLPLKASDAAINEGEYLTLYYNGIGMVFSFNDVITEGSDY